MTELVLTVLLGCTNPPSQARLYVDAAALAESDPAAAADACQALGPELSDECLSFAARAAADSSPQQAGAICGEIGPTVWADECWFLVAEAQVALDGGEAAATTCAKAGRFAANCLDHVRRAHASHLLSTLPPAEAAARYAEALAWADVQTVTVTGGARGGRFWQSFYDAPLHDPSLPALDSGWCATMTGDLATTCQRSAPDTLRHTLVRLERERRTQGQPIDPAVLCADGPAAAQVQAAFDLGWASGESLDEVAERYRSSRCSARQAQDAGHHPGRPR